MSEQAGTLYFGDSPHIFAEKVIFIYEELIENFGYSEETCRYIDYLIKRFRNSHFYDSEICVACSTSSAKHNITCSLRNLEDQIDMIEEDITIWLDRGM